MAAAYARVGQAQARARAQGRVAAAAQVPRRRRRGRPLAQIAQPPQSIGWSDQRARRQTQGRCRLKPSMPSGQASAAFMAAMTGRRGADTPLRKPGEAMVSGERDADHARGQPRWRRPWRRRHGDRRRPTTNRRLRRQCAAPRAHRRPRRRASPSTGERHQRAAHRAPRRWRMTCRQRQRQRWSRRQSRPSSAVRVRRRP